MKALVKLVVCGIIGFAVQANAQSLQVQQVIKTPGGRVFLQSMGITTGSAAELTAAMGRLSTVEQAAVAAAITRFNKSAIAGNSPAAIKQNNELATQIFSQNGKPVSVAALVNNSQARNSVNSAVGDANQCSPELYTSALASGTRVPQPVVKAAYDAKILRAGKNGCTEVTAMGVPARENLNETGECMLNKNAQSMPVASAARDQVGAGCLADAKNNDAGATPTTAQAELTNFKSIRENCGYIQ